MRYIISILACLITFLIPSTAATFYVTPAPIGNNSNMGMSASQPFEDINYAIGNAAAHDTIVVTGIFDIYNTYSTVVINKPIVLLGFGAQLDGGGLAAGTLGKRLMIISDVSDVLIDGFVLKNLIGDYSIGLEILGSGRNITIQHSLITNIGWIPDNIGATPIDSTNNANGILVHGTGSIPLSQLSILYDTITNCALGKSEALTIAGNTDTFSIIGNFVYANSNVGIDIAGSTDLGNNPPPNVNYARNGTIAHNIVFRNMSPLAVSAGIYLDGAFNCVVDRNQVFNNGAGISIGQERVTSPGAIGCSHNRIINNFIYDNAVFGLVLGDNFFNPQTQHNYVGGNTIIKNRTGAIINGISQIGNMTAGTVGNNDYGNIFGGEIQLMNSDSSIIENNILYPFGLRRCINAPDSYIVQHIAIHYNDLYKDTGTAYFDIGTGASVNGHGGPISHLTNTIDLDTLSLSVYPQFVDTVNHNFALDSSSLCRNAGNPASTDVETGLSDFYGNQRIFAGRIDIGAAESQYTEPSILALLHSPTFDVSIFPVPANDVLFITSTALIKYIRVTDITGQLIISIANPSKSINTANWKPGIYIINFVSSLDEKKCKTVVKL